MCFHFFLALIIYIYNTLTILDILVFWIFFEFFSKSQTVKVLSINV